MTGSQDPAAGGERLMAGHADHERVIETLTGALMQSRLTRDELDARASRALAALTAGTPAGTGPASPPVPARGRPLARAAAGSGGCVVIAFAAMRFFERAEPGGPDPAPYHSLALPCLFVALAAVVAALFIVGYGVGATVEQRRSRRRLPPPPGPGGRARVVRVADDAGGSGAGGADVVAW